MRPLSMIALVAYLAALAWAFRIMARPTEQEIEDAIAAKLIQIRRSTQWAR